MELQHKGLEDDFPFSKWLMFRFPLFSMLVFGSVKLLRLLCTDPAPMFVLSRQFDNKKPTSLTSLN